MPRFLKLLLFILVPMSSFGQHSIQRTPEERKVENIIKALPEVKALDNVYDTISNRHQRVKMNLTPPDTIMPFYKAEVGYQGTNRFEPHYYFYINPQTNVILVEDLKHGDRPTLSEWRRRRSPDYTPTNDHSLNPDSVLKASDNPPIKTPQKSDAEFIYR